jgi:hypothetical protein
MVVSHFLLTTAVELATQRRGNDYAQPRSCAPSRAHKSVSLSSLLGDFYFKNNALKNN